MKNRQILWELLNLNPKEKLFLTQSQEFVLFSQVKAATAHKRSHSKKAKSSERSRNMASHPWTTHETRMILCDADQMTLEASSVPSWLEKLL
jgi:hypothetical protein